MKNLFYYCFLILLASACNSRQDEYVIRGGFPGLLDGMSVQLENAESRGDDNVLATDTVRNGRFELRGSVASPVMCHLRISDRHLVKDKRESRTRGTRLFLDNSAIEIKTPCFDSLYYISEYSVSPRELQTEIAGGDLQADYNAYRQAVHDAESDYLEHNGALSVLNFDRGLNPDKYTPEEYARLFAGHYGKKRTAAARMREQQLEFVRRHRQSPLSLYVAEQMANRSFHVTADELAELVELTTGVKDTVRMPRFQKLADQARTYCRNVPFSDVMLYTPAFERDSLSAHIRKGCVTLIDCWASWCGPCRDAIPDVKKLYNHYGRDRFDVVSISLDSKKEDWQKALKEEKMPWAQFIAGKEGYKQLVGNYHFQSIPNLILIDGEGRVVFSSYSPEEVKIELEKIIGD